MTIINLHIFTQIILIQFLIAHPRWISTPNDIISTLGSVVSVQCLVTGSPEPIITWKKYTGKFSDFSVSINVCKKPNMKCQKIVRMYY